MACWTLELTNTTYGSSSNCVGIAGSDDVQTDTGTTLSVTYQNGDPCFVGTIAPASSGWGAVYIFGLATDNNQWNATANGVTGFAFSSRGTTPPASLNVYYKENGDGTDYCRTIAPGETAVPFADAHPKPSCSGGAAGSTVDATDLEEIILAFIPKSQSYSVNFCLQITALD